MVKRSSIEIKGLIEKPEQEEYRRGKLGLVFCKECKAVYYKKSWHHNLSQKLKSSAKDGSASGGKNQKFVFCPACQMIKNRQFEGEIIIKNIPSKIYDDLVNLVKTFSHRAYRADPMDRLIGIKNIGINQLKNQHKSASLVITLTENQLAVKLAKKIKEVFKKAKIEISYSPAPSDVVYIKLTFD